MTRKRISPEINALSTLVFGSVLTLLIVINVRSIRQERAEERRLHDPAPRRGRLRIRIARRGRRGPKKEVSV